MKKQDHSSDKQSTESQIIIQDGSADSLNQSRPVSLSAYQDSKKRSYMLDSSNAKTTRAENIINKNQSNITENQMEQPPYSSELEKSSKVSDRDKINRLEDKNDSDKSKRRRDDSDSSFGDVFTSSNSEAKKKRKPLQYPSTHTSASEETVPEVLPSLPRSYSKREAASKYNGVCWVPKRKKWRSRVRLPNRKRKHIGYYDVEEDAARAYDEQFFFIYKLTDGLNFPEEYTGNPNINNNNKNNEFRSVSKHDATDERIGEVDSEIASSLNNSPKTNDIHAMSSSDNQLNTHSSKSMEITLSQFGSDLISPVTSPNSWSLIQSGGINQSSSINIPHLGTHSQFSSDSRNILNSDLLITRRTTPYQVITYLPPLQASPLPRPYGYGFFRPPLSPIIPQPQLQSNNSNNFTGVSSQNLSSPLFPNIFSPAMTQTTGETSTTQSHINAGEIDSPKKSKSKDT